MAKSKASRQDERLADLESDLRILEATIERLEFEIRQLSQRAYDHRHTVGLFTTSKPTEEA